MREFIVNVSSRLVLGPGAQRVALIRFGGRFNKGDKIGFDAFMAALL